MPHELLEKAQNLRTEIGDAQSGAEFFLERLGPLRGLVIDLKGQLCHLEQNIKIDYPEPIKSDSDLTELLSNDLGLLTIFAQPWSSDYSCPWRDIDLRWSNRVMQLAANLVCLKKTIKRLRNPRYVHRRCEIDAIENLFGKIERYLQEQKDQNCTEKLIKREEPFRRIVSNIGTQVATLVADRSNRAIFCERLDQYNPQDLEAYFCGIGDMNSYRPLSDEHGLIRSYLILAMIHDERMYGRVGIIDIKTRDRIEYSKVWSCIGERLRPNSDDLPEIAEYKTNFLCLCLRDVEADLGRAGDNAASPAPGPPRGGEPKLPKRGGGVLDGHVEDYLKKRWNVAGIKIEDVVTAINTTYIAKHSPTSRPSVAITVAWKEYSKDQRTKT